MVNGELIMKNGYKRTEIGVIPVDWDIVQFGKHLDIFAGFGFNKSEYVGQGIKLLRIDNVSYGIVTWESIAFLPEIYLKKYPNLIIVKDDILLALNRPITNGQLKLAILKKEDSPCILYQRVGKIICRNNAYTKIFAFYVLNKYIKKFVEESSVGTDQPFISTVKLKKYKIPLPPLPEQKAIAEVLSDTDNLIQALEKRIAKKRLIKQGAMQKLLTPKDDWEVKKLGDILKVRHGKSQKDVEDRNGQYPILGTGGLMGYANQFLYDRESVLIGRKGTIDKPRYMNIPFWTVDTLFYTEIFKYVSPKCLFYKFLQIDWYSYNEASGVPSLNAKTIENIEISLPPLEEQTHIATILSDMDSEIKALEKKRAKYKQLKQGLMQNLLTGKIRLI